MLTLSARLFEYEALRTHLKPDDRIVIISCNCCARQSNGLGGQQGLRHLADKLMKDGFKVVHEELLPIACHPELLANRLRDEAVRKLFSTADVIIPLSCQAGEKRAAEILPDLKVIHVTRTLGKGIVSPETGACIMTPGDGIEIDVDPVAGMPLAEVAKLLGLYPGSF